MGEHCGGNTPFSIDITNNVILGNNELRVEVVDRLNHLYPYGKQAKNPSGMWYIQVSGIWQNVWLEYVPISRINDIKIESNMSQ